MQSSNKSELRKQILKQRLSLTQESWREKSDRICHFLQSFPLFIEAKTILSYFSFRQEPDLSSLFSSNHRWGFSRCVDKSLVWHVWNVGEPLQTGNFGIQEPLPTAPILNADDVDLILVPAVACDYQGYRLGYGGGFYDRLLNLPEWSHIPTIGIIFELARLPQLPVDSWDKKLQATCTETNIFIH
ncbi:5-formyltetrahydrofolate cyclo-ligase [Candidatus Gracilibacteria bacterium]|nr:5-formyltetrahydrofolate cyclo-ligase [Candidatus Gracilibacteria bacterium]NJM88348.1 5-formyltetrahydrofolate cyclo-ligase [Hydrococcus sp. RU_2_2]NJP20262.1 5-formyltetrahydrofolate cyclo-ligase [Hydrococcus sp. CRU_1_1]NJQ96743.1 5-formyltetrahydrofolate cyclo-ligase [Hydrococcus sp. CSU_1_8]